MARGSDDSIGPGLHREVLTAIGHFAVTPALEVPVSGVEAIASLHFDHDDPIRGRRGAFVSQL
jgi:hypothetical protein